MCMYAYIYILGCSSNTFSLSEIITLNVVYYDVIITLNQGILIRYYYLKCGIFLRYYLKCGILLRYYYVKCGYAITLILP